MGQAQRNEDLLGDYAYCIVNLFSPTLFPIVEKMTFYGQRSAPYSYNPPFHFLTFGHSGAQYQYGPEHFKV